MKTTSFKSAVGLLLGLSACSVGYAQFVLDGTRDAAYGAALSVQSVETQFGDNLSELNAGYAVISGGNLHLLLTGQVENNFNKLNIFIDSVASGQNVLQNSANSGGNNPENDNWAVKYAGFTFDSAFAADYMIIARNGSSGGNRFDVDFATIGGGLGAYWSAGNIFGGALTGSNPSVGPAGLGVAYDNSNVSGIIGGSGAANGAAAAAVTTGLELVIPLAAIGSPGLGDIIRISAHINGSNHDYLSNQSLGGFAPPQGNLGGDGAGGFNGTVGQLNMNAFAGDQYFSLRIVPEPSAGALSGLGVAALVLSRRFSRGARPGAA